MSRIDTLTSLIKTPLLHEYLEIYMFAIFTMMTPLLTVVLGLIVTLT